MRIELVDLFYFALPNIEDRADGSQDSFLVRLRSDSGLEGYGESDSSPLIAIACYCAPMSHSNIVALSQSLLGQTLEGPEDIRRIYNHARRRAMDVAHFPHAWAAADIALWDLLGKATGQPVYRLLGYDRALPKRAYASFVFPDTPEKAAALAAESRRRGFTAVKFGWGPMGHRGLEYDVELVRQARRGLGDDAALMIDAGCVWGEDVSAALARSRAFAPFRPTWLEEPLHTEAVDAYARLRAESPLAIAAGEGCNTLRAAEDLLVNGRLDFLQIDPGRIGGITPAFDALRLAQREGRTFVNHTFKSHLSLAAAMSVMAGEPSAPWVEYCESDSPLVRGLVANPIELDGHGQVRLTDRPGLGVEVNLKAVAQYARAVTMSIDGRIIGASTMPA